jgi:nitroreductase
MDAIEAIKARRSVRSYSGEKIPEDIISDIIDCARLAPTAGNVQPWLIVAVTDRQVGKRIGRLADHGGFIGDAPACFMVFCRSDEKYYLEDGCAATMNIIMACTGYGIGTCWVAGDKKAYADRARDIAGVDKSYTLVSLVAAGYAKEDAGRPHKKPAADVSIRV